jgi:hypothetical protein
MRWAVLLLCLLLAGCGFGEGAERGDVTLTVTRDFGNERLHEGIDTETANEGSTVMRLLQSNYDVETRYGGGFVQEIDGIAGGRDEGRRADWFYYVNGIEASIGAAERNVTAGERVWWDHHQWEAAQRVPAVVGSFPEPFRTGLEGKRFPVKLICVGDAERSCDEVQERLESSGVAAVSRSVVQQSPGTEVLRVFVGRWEDVRGDSVTRRLEDGPGATGVYARPSSTGDEIVLLDAAGEPARTLRAGGGLVAATSVEEQAPTWVVTGTDDVGLAAAAAALTEKRLEHRFALAVEEGSDIPLPMTGPPSVDGGAGAEP